MLAKLDRASKDARTLQTCRYLPITLGRQAQEYGKVFTPLLSDPSRSHIVHTALWPEQHSKLQGGDRFTRIFAALPAASVLTLPTKQSFSTKGLGF